MKKLILVVMVAAAAVAQAEMKLGTVDMMKLVRNHSSYEPNKKLLTSTEQDYQKRLETMKSELEQIQEEGKKIADELRNPMLAQSAKAKAEEKLVAIQKRFMEGQQKMRNEAMRNERELNEMEARLLKMQAEDIKKQIASFAKKNGYDLIVDGSAAVFAKEALEVTDGVLREMGVDPEKVKKAEKNDHESK